MKTILYALLVWFLYVLIFRFIIPVYKTSKKIKQQVRAMQSQMQEQMQQQQGYSANQTTPNTGNVKNTPVEKTGDYIDFEEVK